MTQWNHTPEPARSRRFGRMRRPGGFKFRPEFGALEDRTMLSLLATSTAVLASTPAAVYGQVVTVTATVLADPPASGIPTGTVTFYDGSLTLGTAALARGTAVLRAPLTAVGQQRITASYSGDVIFAGSASGTETIVAGTGTAGYSGDGGPATRAELNKPLGVAVDAAGNLYFADSSNNRIREVVKATGQIFTVAGNGTVGYSGDGGPAASAELNNPYTVAVDSAGNLYFSDTGNNRIREVIKATGQIFTVVGNGVGGYSFDGVLATSAALGFPVGVAVDAAGNLFFADSLTNRIREVNKATGQISTVAGNGTKGFSGDGGPATSAALNYPVGVALDGSDNIYIADWGNQRLREVVKETGLIVTVAGGGLVARHGITPALLYPSVVAEDGAGHAFQAKVSHNQIARFTGQAIVVVAPDATTTSLTAQAVRNRHGKLVELHLTAHTETVAPGSGVPTGTVTLFVNGRVLSTTTLNDGSAILTVKPRRVLRKTVKISYGGDTDFQSSAAAGVHITPKSLQSTARKLRAFGTRFHLPFVVAKRPIIPRDPTVANERRDRLYPKAASSGLASFPPPAGIPVAPAEFGLAPLPTIAAANAPASATDQAVPSSAPTPDASSPSGSNRPVPQQVSSAGDAKQNSLSVQSQETVDSKWIDVDSADPLGGPTTDAFIEGSGAESVSRDGLPSKTGADSDRSPGKPSPR
jgi:Bacterial Ig-like domain (group 3)/NHL repeat